MCWEMRSLEATKRNVNYSSVPECGFCIWKHMQTLRLSANSTLEIPPPQTPLLEALTTGPTTWEWNIHSPSSCATLVVMASCCPSLRSSPHVRKPCWPSSTSPPTCRRTSIKEWNCQDPCQLGSSAPAPSSSNLSAISRPYPWIRAPPAMFPRCAWQNVEMSANNKINDPFPHAESFLCVHDNIVSGELGLCYLY